MPKRTYKHLELKCSNNKINFSGKSGGKNDFPERSANYFQQKRNELATIEANLKKRNQPLNSILTISGATGKDFLFEQLDKSRSDLRLLSIKEEITNENEKRISANVQFKSEKAFKKFSDSLQFTRKGETKQSRLCLSIETIRELKSFRDLVTDYSIPEDFDSNKEYWFEIWLPVEENGEDIFNNFTSYLSNNFPKIKFNSKQLLLNDRNIALIKTNEKSLNQLCTRLSYMAEIRFAKKVHHFLDLDKEEQIEISDNIISRTTYKTDTNTSSIILDTGVNRGHRFLEPILSSNRNLTLNENWGTHDESYAGEHGTAMAGLCAYGDFSELTHSDNKIEIIHNLTSVKILALNSEEEDGILTPPALLIKTAVELVEKNIQYNKNYILSITTDSITTNKGLPSSYSTLLDTIIFKYRTLFLVSIGNCDPFSDENHHTHGDFSKSDFSKYQDTTCVENPSQAWNCLSIGAYTIKTDCSNLRSEGCMPMAENGDVSPHSRFSMVNYKYDNSPIKPEVLFEGGNMLTDPNGHIGSDHHFQLITTNYNFQNENEFTNFNGTSAATALAGRFASILMENYPEYWAETIRGLMVHSAEWTENMLNRLPNKKLKHNRKDEKINLLLRKCGYGIPDLEKAKNSGAPRGG